VELVKNYEIETQEELAERLSASGLEVTQATVSRDIRELKLTKIATEDGRQKYAVLPSVASNISDRLIRIFRDGVVSMDYAQCILVIKTLEGMAMAVAAAIDAMGSKEIIGTIAGDDTLFCATKREADALALMGRLNAVLSEE
jgi:transcriptional regulator of arginine metabolism